MADALGTRLEVLGGRYTGRLAGPHLFGPGKRHGVEQLVRTHGISLARSVGFADHGSDITFLECFGHAVAVRPRQALRREARLRGWETIEG